MKQLFYLFFFFIFTFVNAQNKKNVPKYGKIIFAVEQSVYNHQKLDSSIKIKKPALINMFRDLYIEMSLKEGITPDSLELNKNIETNLLPSLDFMLDPRKIVRGKQTHSYIFEDSIIKYQIQTSPLDKNNEVTVINRSNGKLSYYTLQDSVMTLDQFTVSVTIKDSNEIISIKEYRNIRKTIFGYDCFKVVVTKTEHFFESLNFLEINVSPEFKEKYKEHIEPVSEQVLYVTEKIKCKYHPFISSSKILDNYYPLEIISKNDFVDGVEKKCIVEELYLE